MSATTVNEQQRQAAERHYGPLGPHAVTLTDGVTGSDVPYRNRNLGNGEPTATGTQIRVARQAVAVGGKDGLRLTLSLAR